jgi:xylan 1,4-beta-xylosidase
MIWHYHDDDLPGPDAAVELEVRGLPTAAESVQVRHYRIDEEHSNAFTAWKRMGEPQSPSPEEYALLEEAGRLAQLAPPAGQPVAAGRLGLRFTLPRQAVSLIVVEY